LENCGANPNSKCSKGDTPVHIAFLNNNYDMILELLRYGVIYIFNLKANLNILNDSNNTPVAMGSLEIL